MTAGISLLELAEMFPDEATARQWFEGQVWPTGRTCPRCGSERTHEASHANSPYRCTDCRAYFSVKTGTALEGSKLPLRLWAYAIYLEISSPKGISSMQLHRNIGVTQKTAWFMLHRLREAWAEDKGEPMSGPVEVDEVYMGGLEKNKHARKKLRAGRGGVGKTPVAGALDRATNHIAAEVVPNTQRLTLSNFVHAHIAPGAMVYSDESASYSGLPDHESVVHSRGEYVRDDVHSNGIESFWALLKRAHKGTFHKISPKHLQRYVNEFAGRHNLRGRGTLEKMNAVMTGLIGRRLMYRDLVAGEPAR